MTRIFEYHIFNCDCTHAGCMVRLVAETGDEVLHHREEDPTYMPVIELEIQTEASPSIFVRLYESFKYLFKLGRVIKGGMITNRHDELNDAKFLEDLLKSYQCPFLPKSDFEKDFVLVSNENHIVEVCYDNEYQFLDMLAILNYKKSFFKRGWIAIKHIFGYNSAYGHWDSFYPIVSDIQKLHAVFQNINFRNYGKGEKTVGYTPPKHEDSGITYAPYVP